MIQKCLKTDVTITIRVQQFLRQTSIKRFHPSLRFIVLKILAKFR